MTPTDIARAFVGTVLVVSAVSKFIGLGGFRSTLWQLKLPQFAVKVGALGIPLLELASAVLILIPQTMLAGELLVFVLVSGFAWANWVGLTAEREIACSCFGSMSSETFGWHTVARVVVLLGLNIYVVMGARPYSLYQSAPIDVISAFLLSLGVLMLYVFTSSLFQTRKAK